jgi:carbon-monoxide dehydrogenase small subunit
MNGLVDTGSPEIALSVNGHEVTGTVEPRTHLADFLREALSLTGTHLGCEQGVCGACTVMLDGRPARSCITLAVACDAADVRTIEGFDDDPLMASLRDAFSRHHGLQCGFCTPGMLATAYDLVRRLPGADTTRIRKELSGNLCRCTGYQGAVMAIEHVLANDPPDAALHPTPRTRSQVASSNRGNSRPDVTESPATTGLIVPDAVTDGITLIRRIALDAAADQIWPVVRDIQAVAGCIPGAAISSPVEDETVHGVIAVAIGPMRASFDGIAKVERNDTARSGQVIGRGLDRLSRSTLDGVLDFKLHGAGENGTELELQIAYRLKGPLAQFGRPAIVEELADRLLAETADRLVAKATGAEPLHSAAKAISGPALIWVALKGILKRLLRRG